MVRSDVIAAGLLFALSAAVFVVSTDFPGGRGGDPGAAFFPRLITGAIAVLALVLLVKHVTADERRTHEIDPTVVRRLVVVAAFPTLYIFVMPIMGFPLTTVVFLAALMWYSGARSAPSSSAVPSASCSPCTTSSASSFRYRSPRGSSRSGRCCRH
ncbi:tripartite tricarboxylate transporter TctB family protein [Halalkalicoccus sp. GCM10025322]|uniref:tripartite tricarboxylate transporter TctB family protein n=1 Tax=Halalkalicoccus sp. GCM10025322 TaxID=3252661 RepID=UPI003611B968